LGTYNTLENQDEYTDCIKCEAGYYCDEEALVDHKVEGNIDKIMLGMWSWVLFKARSSSM
jgi:hypothetical protein